MNITIKADDISRNPPYTALKLDALERTGRAASILWTTQTTDETITPYERIGLKSVGRELQENYALAAFALRVHTANLSRFRLSVDTDDQPFNRKLERMFAEWGDDPRRCDAARRHSFAEMMRLIELLRVREGDVGILWLKDGSIQIVEGDRVRNDGDVIEQAVKGGQNWVQGVRVGDRGQPLAYNVCKRQKFGGFEQERIVSADFFDLVGYFNAYDQIRGVSPLTAALAPFTQIYDAKRLAIARMQIEQLIGFVAYQDNGIPLGKIEENKKPESGVAEFTERWGDGANFVRLGPNDRLETVQSAAPGNNFQPMLEFSIRVAFAALDIPYSFLKGSDTNFYGSRGELNQYVNGCKQKQEGLRVFLNRLFRRLVRLWTLEGKILDFPPGLTAENLPFKWIGAAVPWWRLVDDAKGLILAAQAGLLNLEDVANWHQTELYENIERNAYAVEQARAAGFPLAIDPQKTVNVGL